MKRLALLAFLLAGCADGRPELVVAAPPGRIADLQTWFAPPFEERTGARIVPTGLRSGDQVARVRIERGVPSLDVLWIDAGEAALLGSEGLVEGPLPPTFSSAVGFLYNTDALPDPPRSWAALALTDRLALFGFGSTLGPLTVGVLARAATGDETDGDAGFERLRAMRGNVLQFGTSGPANNQLVAQGEAWLTLGLPSQARHLAAGGAPVGWIAPEEGAVALPQGVQVVADARNLELARAFADYMFSAEAQAVAARELMLVPSRDGVPLPDGLPSPSELLRLDMAALGELRAGWTARFRREILGE